VAKKLSEIKQVIKDQELSFYHYLTSITPFELTTFINKTIERVDIYVFSGVIRNYFLNSHELRDIDFVVEDISRIREVIENYEYRENSFGGFKIKIGEMDVDLWETKNTWAFKYQNEIDYKLFKVIPNTSFFNFSSVIYHLNRKEFIYNEDFLNFLRKKELEISFYPNPNHQLCLINTLYYSEKYKLTVGKKLKSFLRKQSTQIDSNYPEVQIKHFGKIIYSQKELEDKIDLVIKTNRAFETVSR
tara:strand:+ start:22246 stop:22980 length:735 start_codon:yes stop_codon:yes gene_type:complete